MLYKNPSEFRESVEELKNGVYIDQNIGKIDKLEDSTVYFMGLVFPLVHRNRQEKPFVWRH